MTYHAAEVRLPSWPAPYAVRLTPGPYGPTACACKGDCGGRCTDLAPLGGLGFTMPSPGSSAVTLLAVAAGGFLLYKYVFQNRAKARAKALRAATSRYKAQQAAIRARYA